MCQLLDASKHDINRQDHKNLNQLHSKVSDHRQLAAEIVYISETLTQAATKTSNDDQWAIT